MKSKYLISEEKIKKIIENIFLQIKDNNLNESISNNLDIEQLVKSEFNLAKDSEKDIFEGIKYDTYTKEVEYSDLENSVNTSIKDNPTVDNFIFPGVEIWSIFQRKDTPDFNNYDNRDGNPLLYAFKNEDDWHFKSPGDRKKFIYLFEQIIQKFLLTHHSDITVVIPSGNSLNMLIANTISRYDKDTIIITDLLRKLTVEEVWNTLDNLDSPFRKKFGKTREEWEDATHDLFNAFNKMKKYRDGKFTFHFLPNNEPYREYISDSLTSDEFSRGKYANDLYNRNILLIDDSISRGRTITNACDIIYSFQPKSITVLTMFSKKK